MIDEIEKRAKYLFNKVTLDKRKPSETELKNLLIEPEDSENLMMVPFMDVFKDFIRFLYT